MRELERLLPELAPPPGGLARLQRSVPARRRPFLPRFPRWLPAAAGACALALLALAWLPGTIQRERRSDALTQALLQAVASPPMTDGIRVANGAALALPSSQANARVYLVETTATATPTGTHQERDQPSR